MLGAGEWLGPTVWLLSVSTSTWIMFFHLVTSKENNSQCFFRTHAASPPLLSSLNQCWSQEQNYWEGPRGWPGSWEMPRVWTISPKPSLSTD